MHRTLHAWNLELAYCRDWVRVVQVASFAILDLATVQNHLLAKDMKSTNRGLRVQKPTTALHANLRPLMALGHLVHQGACITIGTAAACQEGLPICWRKQKL